MEINLLCTEIKFQSSILITASMELKIFDEQNKPQVIGESKKGHIANYCLSI